MFTEIYLILILTIDEDDWDFYVAGLCEAYLDLVKRGRISPEQSCFGEASYDHRTRTGVVMLLDEDSLRLLKGVVRNYKIAHTAEDGSETVLAFRAVGAFDRVRKPIFGRINQIPYKFDLADPMSAHEYIEARVPFLPKLPFELTMNDFAIPSEPYIRKETKVLLKILATPRLVEYIKHHGGIIPFPGALMGFEKIRLSTYEKALLDHEKTHESLPTPRPRSGNTRQSRPTPARGVSFCNKVPSPSSGAPVSTPVDIVPEAQNPPAPHLAHPGPKDVLRITSPRKSSAFKNFSVQPSRKRPDLLHSIHQMLSLKVVGPPQGNGPWKKVPPEKQPPRDSGTKPD